VDERTFAFFDDPVGPILAVPPATDYMCLSIAHFATPPRQVSLLRRLAAAFAQPKIGTKMDGL
jgi:hypothetical protein